MAYQARLMLGARPSTTRPIALTYWGQRQFMDGEFTVGCRDPTTAPASNVLQLLDKLLAGFADCVDRQILHRVGLRDGVHVISLFTNERFDFGEARYA